MILSMLGNFHRWFYWDHRSIEVFLASSEILYVVLRNIVTSRWLIYCISYLNIGRPLFIIIVFTRDFTGLWLFDEAYSLLASRPTVLTVTTTIFISGGYQLYLRSFYCDVYLQYPFTTHIITFFLSMKSLFDLYTQLICIYLVEYFLLAINFGGLLLFMSLDSET